MKSLSTKKLVLFAMFAALQVVLSKFLMIMVTPSIRLSIDSVPIHLAALLFGPLGGALVGMIGDLLGTLLFPTAGAWYPPLTLCYGVIGLVSGLFSRRVKQAPKNGLILLAVAAGELSGSLLCKTLALSRLMGLPFLIQLSARVLPVLVNLALDGLLLCLLYRPLAKNLKEGSSPLPSNEHMTYEEALSYIHSVDWRGTVFGLSRVEALLARFGNPQEKLKFVHVAGTNGKGSTAAMLAAIFEEAGYKTGLYTSPYITRFNERIQVNGTPIPDDALARLTERARALTADMADKPTEFELITALGFTYFFEQGCDIVITEVGMGGRLDATNVIKSPELSIITSIGLDHTAVLGDTLSKIAYEKAGILKPGRPAVFYGDCPEAEAVIRSLANEKGCALTLAHHDRMEDVRWEEKGFSFRYAPYGPLFCNLTGTYQIKNTALALTAAEVLSDLGWALTPEAIRAGLARVGWPGRFEILSRSPLVILDGGHNPQGVTAAKDSLQALYPGKKATVLLGIMADKDVDQVLSILRPVAEQFVTVTPDNPRAMAAPLLAEKLSALGAQATPAPTVSQGVALALEMTPADGILLALGSLYMSQAIRNCFTDETTGPRHRA